MNSIYWYDYETFGIDSRRDRVAQFAGVRTDEQLNIVGKPLMLYCQPAADFLPNPEACLLTGITPQLALEKGVIEATFIERINQEFSQPKTCVSGYNNLRFDDEFTRNLLYRNFFDPYAREWQHGNSRWDIIDMVRLTRALRPEGIEWPVNDDGSPSFRLELLTVANRIQHVGAHDALSDVYATINLARLIRERQPRLYEYVYQLRHKNKVAELLSVQQPTAVLHVSNKYPASQGCMAIVAPIALHSRNRNEVVVLDLRCDPGELLALSVEDIQQRVFVASSDLPVGQTRLPIKTIRLNRSPVVVPLATLTPSAADEWQLDSDLCLRHLQVLKQYHAELREKLAAVFAGNDLPLTDDPDLAIYSGGFFSDMDRQRMTAVRHASPEDLATMQFGFDDWRLPDMLFRYRARNYPQSLSPQERVKWLDYCHARLTGKNQSDVLNLEQFSRYVNELQTTRTDVRSQALLKDLSDYADKVLSACQRAV